MNAMAHRSSGRRRHGLALGIALFAALSPHSPAPGADPPDPWTPELRAAIAKLEVGETEAATGKLTMLLEESAGHGGPEAVYEKNIGTILLYRAIALQQAGRVDDAKWDIDLAAVFLPDVKSFDLGRFGEAGILLSEYARGISRKVEPPASEPAAPAEGGARPGLVMPPKVVRRSRPDFPTTERRFRAGAALLVQFVIDESGRVTHPRVIEKLPHPSLTYAALASLREWKFVPATLDGRPVKVYYDLTVHYNPR